jgi:hypothetical protein
MDIARRRIRSQPIIVGAAAVALIGALAGAIVTDLLPLARSPVGDDSKQADQEKRAAIEGARSSDERLARAQPGATCANCGVVESIRMVEVTGDSGIVVQQYRDGRGAATSTVDDDEASKSAKRRIAYRVTMLMDDGSYRTVSQSAPPPVAVGNKVRIVEGAVVARQ